MKTFKPLASTLLVLASLVPGMSTAQSTNDWKFEASIYAYLPDISGRVVFPPPVGGQDVSVDVGTILDNLKFAFMGAFEARRGQWGAFTRNLACVNHLFITYRGQITYLPKLIRVNHKKGKGKENSAGQNTPSVSIFSEN